MNWAVCGQLPPEPLACVDTVEPMHLKGGTVSIGKGICRSKTMAVVSSRNDMDRQLSQIVYHGLEICAWAVSLASIHFLFLRGGPHSQDGQLQVKCVSCTGPAIVGQDARLQQRLGRVQHAAHATGILVILSLQSWQKAGCIRAHAWLAAQGANPAL